jgi:hypothetical protein
MEEVAVVGLDIAKSVFQLHGVSRRGAPFTAAALAVP